MGQFAEVASGSGSLAIEGLVGELREMVEGLRDRERIRLLTESAAIGACQRALRSGAQDQLVSLCTALPPLTELNDQVGPASCREIYPAAVFSSAVHRRWAADRVGVGRRIRTLPSVAAGVTVADEDAALVVIPSDDSGGEVRAVHIRDVALVRPMRSFLESAWRAALPVTSASPAPALTRRQYAIGNLLSDGLKDEVIARSLGLSLRTIRAEVSALCTALDAASRFQAGARFARLTTVTPEVDRLC